VTDKMGKIFIAHGSLRKCAICDVLMNRETSREHSTEICFPVPPACPPISYGVVAGAA
jgi:hypothetical protein